MIDQLKRTELTELSFSVLMALLWVQLAANLLQKQPREDIRLGNDTTIAPPLEDKRYQHEVNGIVTALQTAPCPIYVNVWEQQLLPATRLLAQVGRQMDLILTEGRDDLAPETLALLDTAHNKLQHTAGVLSRMINPDLPKGNGMTLAVLFLRELAASAF